MKKRIFGIALALALVATMVFGSVALADGPPHSDDEVHIDWESNGTGSITLDSVLTGCWCQDFSSRLYVETTGSHSDGWQDITAGGFELNRYAYVEDGIVVASTHEKIRHTYVASDVDCLAYLDTDGTGFILQSYSFESKNGSTVNSHIEADCLYEMGAVIERSKRDYPPPFGFIIGATGEGSGVLNVGLYSVGGLSTPDGFYFDGDTNVDAGFGASWNSVAEFATFTETPSIAQGFDVNVTDSGNLDSGAYSDSWVTIAGFINQLN